MREDLLFGGCEAWLYRPEGADGDVPCVVMAHGFSLTRHDALPVFAEAFAAANPEPEKLFDFGDVSDDVARSSGYACLIPAS